MQLIILAVIVGIIALVGLIIYVTNSGLVTLRKELAESRQEAVLLRRQLAVARRGLFEIGGGQAGQPVATALSTIDQVEALADPERNEK